MDTLQRLGTGILILGVLLCACNISNGQSQGQDRQAAASAVPLDFTRIEQITGIKGTAQDGEYKVSVPQDDLNVSVDGFRIIPPMGLTSWAAFAPASDGAMVMGDFVLLEDEVGPVQRTLIEGGLTVSGLHNHFVRDQPGVMFMHIYGMGPVETLANGVRATLDKVKELRAAKRLQRPPMSVNADFDPKTIDTILGHSGQMNAGVYKVTIGRPDITLMDHGVPVSTFMGFNTWMAFQGTEEKAAVAGDFAMLEDEVGPVIQSLVQHGIEVVAVHNHMVHETPRVFFLHFWGVGAVETLARGLKAGLEQTGPGAATQWGFDEHAVGQLPPGWRIETTNLKGKPAEWSVQRDDSAPSGDRVLALTNPGDSRGSTFNLCWTDTVDFQDGRIEVKVRAGTGREDQGGGPVWRVQDQNNYYVARWNPLEDNFRLYYVRDGNRRQIASANVNAAPDAWHAIAIHHRGTHIEGYLDGEKLLEQDDSTFLNAGGIGVWTKADAATSFDDFIIRLQTSGKEE
jgi:hypothetical protein